MQDYIPVHELHPQRNSITPSNDISRVLDIVFFHGLQISSRQDAWQATWTNLDGECWPRDWLPHDARLAGLKMRVLSVSYNAQISGHFTGSFGTTAESLTSISQHLFHALTRWSVGDVPFVLVGHSYGGLVIKSLVVHCKNNDDDANAASFMRNLRGVVSYGVPHEESNLAALASRANSFFRMMRLSRLVDRLEPFDRENQQLSEQFRVAIQNRGFGGAGVKLFAFAEQLKTNGVMVVPEVSARGGHRGINEFLVLQQTNHYTMCKPNSPVGEAYAMFVDFLVTKIIAADSALEWYIQHPQDYDPYDHYMVRRA